MSAELQLLARAGATFTLCTGKRPHGEGWQNTPHSLGAALAHLHRGGNVGLLAGEYSRWLIALDLDARAREFEQKHADICDWKVFRDNAPDRAKYIVRCITAHNRKDRTAGLEVLSTHSNAILAGIHESGAPVRMELMGPLPELLLEELAARFSEWTGRPYAAQAQPRAKAFDPLPLSAPLEGAAFNVQMLLRYVARWRADDYNEWIRIGMAVKHECGDSGFGIWDDWSRQSGKYDPNVCKAKWSTFAGDGKVTVRTLAYLAKTDGGYELR